MTPKVMMSGFFYLRRVIALLTGNAAAFERVADFMATVSRIQDETTRSAHRRAYALGEQSAAALRALRDAGQLTPLVEAKMQAQVTATHEQLGQLTDEFGDRLEELARAYRAPEARAAGVRQVVFSVVSVVVFLVLIGLGVGPVGVLVVLVGIGLVGALRVYLAQADGAGRG